MHGVIYFYILFNAGGTSVAVGDYIPIVNRVIHLGPDKPFVDIPVDIVNDDVFECLVSTFYGNIVQITTGDSELVTVYPSKATAVIVDDEGIIQFF